MLGDGKGAANAGVAMDTGGSGGVFTDVILDFKSPVGADGEIVGFAVGTSEVENGAKVGVTETLASFGIDVMKNPSRWDAGGVFELHHEGRVREMGGGFKWGFGGGALVLFPASSLLLSPQRQPLMIQNLFPIRLFRIRWLRFQLLCLEAQLCVAHARCILNLPAA